MPREGPFSFRCANGAIKIQVRALVRNMQYAIHRLEENTMLDVFFTRILTFFGTFLSNSNVGTSRWEHVEDVSRYTK